MKSAVQTAVAVVVLSWGWVERVLASDGQHPGSDDALSMGEIEQAAITLRERALEVLSKAPEFFQNAATAMEKASPTGDPFWHLQTVIFSLLFIAVGILLSRLGQRWSYKHFFYLFNPQPADRAEKITYLLARFVLKTINIGVFAGTAILLALILDNGTNAARATHAVSIGTIALVWGVSVLSGCLFASDAPSHRVLNIDDLAARQLHRQFVIGSSIVSAAFGFCIWMRSLGLDRDSLLLAISATLLIFAVLLTVMAHLHRDTIAGVILGPGDEADKPALLRILAGSWHMLFSLYLLFAWATSSVRLLLDLPSAGGLVAAPILVLLLAIGAYGLLLVIIDRVAVRRGMGSMIENAGEGAASAGNELDAGQKETEGDEEETAQPRVEPLRALAERVAAILVAFGSLWLLLQFWGLDMSGDGGLFVRLLHMLIVGFLAYIIFQFVKVTIDRKIEAEGPSHDSEPGAEGGGAADSRLATVLPLVKKFLLITVVVIAAMTVLSHLGVDIAPLFAAAGVVGLAVGFGAQTLIRDIFSGAFFLVDDAFRKGEYIDIGHLKGTVEKISIRSLQLRHHKGALHTIPFGEIKQLSNHSRDWAIMKLPLRLTYDTDVEKVHKLIKALGRELLDDPIIGDKFLEPLKAQGVRSMEDSAMIFRVKFMTPPGEQFVVRKKVYASIRELFEKEGIKFAHREVTVRVTNEEDASEKNLTPKKKKAIAGAAVAGISGDGGG